MVLARHRARDLRAGIRRGAAAKAKAKPVSAIKRRGGGGLLAKPLLRRNRPLPVLLRKSHAARSADELASIVLKALHG